MSRGGLVFAGFVVFLLGNFFGQSIAGDPEVKYKIVHDVRTEKVDVEVKVPYTPDACKTIIDDSTKVIKAAANIDKTSNQMLDIMSRLRIAIATGDTNAANDLETELRKLSAGVVGSSETIGTLSVDWDTNVIECSEGMK